MSIQEIRLSEWLDGIFERENARRRAGFCVDFDDMFDHSCKL